MLEKREWVLQHCDPLRRALMHEPRGHADMYGAVLTEPCDETAHAGVLFMHNEGYSTMCGHGVIAICTIALERGLIGLAGDSTSLVLESPAGLVYARVTRRLLAGDSVGDDEDSMMTPQVEGVAFDNVPSFVFHARLPIVVGDRTIPVDVAYGGAFYAVVDSEAVGVPLPDAVDAADVVARDIADTGREASQGVFHPPREADHA